MTTNRRDFLRATSLAAAGVGFGTTLKAKPFQAAPSDKLNVALIGVRNMGFGILERHLETGLVNCVALCDVDRKLLEKRAADVQKSGGLLPQMYGDFRQLLERKDVDAVIIGTPDHWHCLQTVYACEAGKDVYVEKPMANSIAECDLMVKAARKYNRIVQVGQQQRSGAQWQEVNRMIKAGTIGKLRKVNIWGNFNYGVGQIKQPNQPVPDGVDFDMWLGPAPLKPFNPARFHGSWRMFWDHGGGLMTDWGVHLIDMAFWAKDLSTPPEITLASGGNLSFQDNDHETFDTMSVIWQHGDFIVTWEHTAGTQGGPWDKNYGLAFIGDNATIVVNRQGYKVIPEWDGNRKVNKAEPIEVPMQGENHGEHVANFIECVKSRKTPACPPEKGRVVAVAAHAANIAVRTGENKLVWDEQKGKFSNSETANNMVDPKYRKPWELPII
jgi:predicted dehydrogenase